ncbi:hypothetical protein [Streptomyces sp. KL116D]|uniref:hypothetical protein n=1 Tax=Streptomyces sp. KL116D TaxID=3045152 RepID=UPI003557CABD
MSTRVRGAGTAGETGGITEVELGPALWQRTCSFPFDGRRWDQDEWYFLARGWRRCRTGSRSTTTA